MDTDGALAAALAHHRRGNPARAEELCREIMGAEPGRADALHLLGILLCGRGEIEPAIDLYRRAIAHAPHDATLRVHLGKALSDSGRETEAEESYRKAIAIDPAHPEAHADLGVLRQRTGDLPGAVASYREALRLDISSPLPHYNLATALRSQGNLTKAIEHAGKVAEQVPDAPAPRLLLADLRLEAGDAEGALEDCRLCLRHEARNRRAIALEAIALARLGDHAATRALLDLDRLVRSRRVDPPHVYPDGAGFDAALARIFAHRMGATGSEAAPAALRPVRSGELLRGAGGVPGALAARFAEGVTWYLDRRPRDSRHRFLKWHPRDFHVEGDALLLAGGQRSEADIRERGWVSGLYAAATVRNAEPRPRVELGAPPPRLRGERPFEGREVSLEAGRLVLFPSYLFHSLWAPEGSERHFVVTFDMVPD